MMALDCVKAASIAFNVPLDEITGSKRSHWIVQARFASIYIATGIFNHKISAIGRAINRDWTSVLNGQRRAELWMRTDALFESRVKSAMALLAPSDVIGRDGEFHRHGSLTERKT